jgi:hypothetical protein
VGIFGSIIKKTNVEGILQLDLLATDFFADKAYPSYLYYNPYEKNKTITVTVPKGKKVDLYDTVSGTFLTRNVSSSTKIELRPKSSVVVVIVPSKGTVTHIGSKMLVNGTVIDYNSGK